MKIGDQIAFSLSIQKRPKREINSTVNELAEQLEITHLLNRLPDFLSGGEKQRVALARAFAMKPVALCLDEPLSALDEDLHREICSLLENTVKKRELTCFHITHSRKEAMAVSDKTFRIENGLIQKILLKEIEEAPFEK